MKKQLLILSLLNTMLLADSNTSKYYEAKDWGVGIVIRHASIPFSDPRPNMPKTATYENSVVPLFYFENDYIFLNGLEGGFKAYEDETYRLSLISRLRFENTPKDVQNDHQLDTYDFGLQARYKFDENNFFDTEILSELHGNYHTNLMYRGDYDFNSWNIEPYAGLRIKSAKFNSFYYGLIEDLKWGIDYNTGLDIKYHVTSNFYLLAGVQAKIFDNSVRDAILVDKPFEYNTYAGIAFMHDKTEKRSKALRTTPYIRISHGYATHSDIDQIFGGNLPKESYGNTLTSIFYGHPLSDTLFSLPIESYLSVGFAWHPKSEVQDNIQEYVIAIKGYYTIPLPIRVRLGIAEGISHVSEVTYIEKTDVNKDGFKESKVLNFLDFSVDVNLGDLFFTDSMNKFWLGINVHHRSGIFSYSSQYGRVSGGSNYPSCHLQMHF